MIYEHRQLERRSVAGRVRNIIAAAAIALAACTASSSAFGESVTVSNTAGPVHTSSATEQGAVYQITASGVVSDWSDHSDGVDAMYCYGEWRCAQPEVWQQLRIDGKGMSEIAGHDIPYSGGHSYSVEYTGTGSPIEFYMSDAMSSAGDNSGAIQVTVTKIRDANNGGDNGNGNGGDTGDEEMPQLQAAIVCDPDPLVITISELPSRTCTIWISHWKRNTAEPVRVFMPNAVDGYGNHANGIQIFGAYQLGSAGGMDPSNMSGYAGRDGRYGTEYPWGLFVFACPGQPGTGANCYGSVTAPGPFTVLFIVRQTGAREAQVMLSGTALPALPTRGPGGVNPPVTPPAGAFVRIHNRWQTNQFLHIEHGGIESGPIQAAWWSAQWTIEPVQGTTFVRIHNRWKPDQFLHIEHGVIESGAIQPAWWSAMWQIEPVAGTPYVRLQNHWKPDQYLHVEHGVIESGQILPAWWSAMWTIEP